MYLLFKQTFLHIIEDKWYNILSADCDAGTKINKVFLALQ